MKAGRGKITPSSPRLRGEAREGGIALGKKSPLRKRPPPLPLPRKQGRGAYPLETYHACHLPLAYADGTPTGKADWPRDALDRLVNPRLLAARETQWELNFLAERYGGGKFERQPFGTDQRAQLQGGVWLCAAAHPSGTETPLSLRYVLAHFAGDAAFLGASFAGYADFERASFAGSADFQRAPASPESPTSKAPALPETPTSEAPASPEPPPSQAPASPETRPSRAPASKALPRFIMRRSAEILF